MIADLYLDSIDPLRYFTASDCTSCGCDSCGEWLTKLKQGLLKPAHCPTLGSNRAHALKLVLSMERILPRVEITQHPVKGVMGHQEINAPGPDAPVLVSGNALITQEVLMAVLSTTTAPFHVLFVDCLGHTVDMAVIYGAFTPEKVSEAQESSGLASRVSHRELILPGATASLRDSYAEKTGWDIRIGPQCAGELPLYFADSWRLPQAWEFP